jgi:hypothetical protein
MIKKIINIIFLSFITFAGAAQVYILPLEDFEGGSLPTNWTNNRISGAVDWAYVGGGRTGVTPTGAYDGSYNATFWEDAFSNSETRLVTPELDFTGNTTNPSLTFYHIQQNWSGDVDTLGIYYKTSSGGSWVFITNYTTAQETWTLRTVALPNVNGTYYVGFKAHSNYGRGCAIDNVQITVDGSVTWDGSTDNDWLTASNWSTNTVPAADKTVIIPTSASYVNFLIIDEATAVCASLSLLGDAYLQVASGKLTIGGTVDMASTSEIQFDGGELECAGQFNADGILDINSGTLDIDNTLDISATVTEELTGGTIEIEDNLANTGGTWTPSGSNTITFDGSGNSVITDADGISFYNLTLNKDAIGQTLTCNSANDDITVDAAFTITQGTMTPTLGDFTVTGNTVLTAGKFIAIDAVSTFNGDVTLNNAAIMDHQGTPDLSTTEFIIAGNIILNGTSGFQSSTSTTDYLTLTGAAKTISVNTAANSESINIYLSGGATYQLNSDWRIEKMQTSAAANVFTVATGNTLTIDDSFYQRAGSTLTLAGSANMNVGTTSWCAPEAGCIFNLNTGTLNVDGATSLTGASGTFNANSGIMLLAGDVLNSATGTFNCGTSLLKCDAAAATTLQMNGDAVYHLEVEKTSNGITPLSALDINGYLEIDDGDFDAATFTHTVAGDFITSGGTFTQNTSTINFDGGSTQAVNVTIAGGTTPNTATINFYNLTASGSDVRIYYDVSINKVYVLNDLTISGKLINIEK